MRLTNYLYKAVFPKIMLAAASMAIIEFLFLIFFAQNAWNISYISYDMLLDKTYIKYIFIIYVFLSLIIWESSISALYNKAKGIYTILTLPVNRYYIVFSNILTGFLSIFTIVATQIAVVFLSYKPLMYLLQRTITAHNYIDGTGNNIEYLIPTHTNGLFLALSRSELLRMILPFNITEFFFYIIVAICLVTTTYHATMRQRGSGGALSLAVLICFRDISVYTDGVYMWVIALLGLSIWSIIGCCKDIKHNELI